MSTSPQTPQQVVSADLRAVKPAVDPYPRTNSVTVGGWEYREMLAFAAFVNRATPHSESFKALFEDAARDIAAITASPGIAPKEAGGAALILHTIGTMLEHEWTRVADRLPEEGVHVLV